MSIQTHGDDPEDDVTVGEFDRVTLKAPNGSTTTLQGRLPYEMVGFDWRFVTTDSTRIRAANGDEAFGTEGGTVVARGIVGEILVEPDTDIAELHVEPP